MVKTPFSFPKGNKSHNPFLQYALYLRYMGSIPRLDQKFVLEFVGSEFISVSQVWKLIKAVSPEPDLWLCHTVLSRYDGEGIDN